MIDCPISQPIWYAVRWQCRRLPRPSAHRGRPLMALWHGPQRLSGTLLGHSPHQALISLYYFRYRIATVERREASVPRHGRAAPH